jgi:hypothetical protein
MKLPDRELSRLNDLLGAELGRNPYGEPLYRWDYADDLMHWRRKGAAYNMVQIPGSPLILAEPEYEQVRLCPWLSEQYALTLWTAPSPEAQWRATFGDKLLWPRRGYYMPTNIALDREEAPTIPITWEVIDTIRKQRQKTFADHVADGERALDYEERAKAAEARDAVADAMTAFGNVPGKRGGHVAFQNIEN